MQIFEYPNFVSNLDCHKILHWFHSKTANKTNGEEFFNNRTIPYVDVDDPSIKMIMNKFRFDATIQAIVSFNKKLYPEYTDLVFWPIGQDMTVHSDAYYPDGSPGKYPHRYCGGVLYLNDNYEGGETYFPEFNVNIKPEMGKLALFSSDLEHKHGVTKVLNQKRYTMPIWFTEDPRHIEV